MEIQAKIELITMFAAGVAASVLLLGPTIRLAFRIGLVDKPDKLRKFHGKSTAYMGGAILWVGVMGGLLAEGMLRGTTEMMPVAISCSILFLTGIVDDAHDLRPWLKLVFQFLSVGILVWSIPAWHPASGSADLAGLCILVVLGVGIVNAFNLIDGLDGLALGIGILSTTPFFLRGWMDSDHLQVAFALAFLAAATGLLKGNLHPAKIFLGDAGSLQVGCIVFAFALQGQAAPGDGNLSRIGELAPLLVGIPFVDMVVVMRSRIGRGVPVFQGERTHIHHRLLKAGHSHESTVGILHAATGVLSLFEAVLVVAGIPLVWTLLALPLWIPVYRLASQQNPVTNATTNEGAISHAH